MYVLIVYGLSFIVAKPGDVIVSTHKSQTHYILWRTRDFKSDCGIYCGIYEVVSIVFCWCWMFYSLSYSCWCVQRSFWRLRWNKPVIFNWRERENCINESIFQENYVEILHLKLETLFLSEVTVVIKFFFYTLNLFRNGIHREEISILFENENGKIVKIFRTKSF